MKSQLLPEGFRDSLPDLAGKEYLISSSFLNLMKKNHVLLKEYIFQEEVTLKYMMKGKNLEH